MASVPNDPAAAPGAETLAERYRRIRSAGLALAAPLAPEDQVVQTIPEVSPTKWHLAHVTWFFERFCLLEHAPAYSAHDERYHYLFNSYYYTVGEMHGRPRRGLLSRPTVAEIHDYRRCVDDAMLALIDERRDDEAFRFLVELGLHHEQQHQELLLTDIKHVFFSNPLGPAYEALPEPPRATTAPLKFVSREGGLLEIGTSGTNGAEAGAVRAAKIRTEKAANATIGANNASSARSRESAFCFDNETPRHQVLVRPHALGHRLVTNDEYREFIDDGGYTDPALWLSDGWAALREAGWDRPLCWSDDLEREFTLGGWREIDPDSPVCHVSYYEADAFARWAGARLPSEAEWETAAAEQAVAGNLLDKGFLHPASTGEMRRLTQLYGDVWEWTSSPYAPYPGFKPLAGSLGEYNGKFMCNQMVVRGGSCVTWREHVRATYRSFFYPKDRWQLLGFRLAKDA